MKLCRKCAEAFETNDELLKHVKVKHIWKVNAD